MLLAVTPWVVVVTLSDVVAIQPRTVLCCLALPCRCGRYRNTKGDIIKPYIPDQGGLGGPTGASAYSIRAQQRMSAKFHALDTTGIVQTGVRVEADDVLVNKYSPKDQSELNSSLGGAWRGVRGLLLCWSCVVLVLCVVAYIDWASRVVQSCSRAVVQSRSRAVVQSCSRVVV